MYYPPLNPCHRCKKKWTRIHLLKPQCQYILELVDGTYNEEKRKMGNLEMPCGQPWPPNTLANYVREFASNTKWNGPCDQRDKSLKNPTSHEVSMYKLQKTETKFKYIRLMRHDLLAIKIYFWIFCIWKIIMITISIVKV